MKLVYTTGNVLFWCGDLTAINQA